MKLFKKGGIVDDSFLISIFVFIFVFTLVFCFYFWISFDNNIQNMDVGDADSKLAIHNMGNWFLFLDKLLPFIFVVLWFSVILSSLLVNPEHPAFFLVSLVSIFIYTIVAIILVDFGKQLFSNEIIVSVSSQLSNSMFFANNLHFISFFVMLISSVWFFSKGNREANQRGVIR